MEITKVKTFEPKTMEETLKIIGKKLNPNEKIDLQHYNFMNGMNQGMQHFIKMWTIQFCRLHPEILGEEFMELLAKYTEAKDTYNLKDCWLIVVNVKPEVWENQKLRDKFTKVCIERAMKKKWIVKCKLWFEWRDHSLPHPKGLHANFVVKAKYPLSRVKTEFYNSFKKFIGEKIERRDEYINVQQASSKKWEKLCNYQFTKGKFEKDDPVNKKFGLESIYNWEVKDEKIKKKKFKKF